MHPPMKTGDDPLGAAAINGHIQTVMRLLEGGANINYQDKVGIVYYQQVCNILHHKQGVIIRHSHGDSSLSFCMAVVDVEY